MEQRLRDLEDRVITLEGELRQLKAQGATAAPPATPPSAPTVQAESTTEQGAAGAPVQEPRLGGAGAAASKALEADISVIGDFISGSGHNPRPKELVTGSDRQGFPRRFSGRLYRHQQE